MLVVAESSYADRLEMLQPVCQAILNESGTLRWHQFPNINKYQEAEGVWKELLELYVEVVGVRLPLLCAEYKTKFIGIYSPVHRCLQSSFALTFAQLIAEKHPALYLNFEHYIGIMELLPERQNRDLADLLYFLAGDPDKFSLRMQTVIQKLTHFLKRILSLRQTVIQKLTHFLTLILSLKQTVILRLIHLLTLTRN